MGNCDLKLILASASPRRKELLGHLNIPFEVLTLNVAEESEAIDPVTFSSEIAHLKGAAVLEKLRKEKPSENFLIISADTIVCLKGKIFGKPKDRTEAKLFLSELSGQTHSVFTAVCASIRYEGKEGMYSFVEESKVTFDSIAPALLESYLDTGDSLDKAGAYGIQGPSLAFISKVDGCYANVVGFPLSRFYRETEEYFKKNFSDQKSWPNYFI